MSKQFYKYLSDRLIKFLSNNSVKAGERFYIQLDEKSQVEELYNVLKEDENVESFIYKHSSGGEYNTFSIKLNDVNLVVASTIDVTSGYLVTIRNASKEQLGVWENTALLILCAETLDSIKGGCCDLRKDGMPLSVKFISINLNSEIDNSNLSKVDKEVVKFYINQKLSDLYNTNLWDYKEILSMINKNYVDKEDYKGIGLFIDKSLNTLSNKQIEKRLKENYELFSKVEGYQEYEDKTQYLEKYFDDKGVESLRKENWKDLDFGEVKRSFDENKKGKVLGYIENIDKTITEGVIFWEKAQSHTLAGQRKRHIIVFNNGILDEVMLNFKFDDTLYKEFIENKSKTYMSVAGKKMSINLPADRYKPKFYKLTYEHNKQSKSTYEFYIAIINIEEKYLKNIKTIYEVKVGSGKKDRIRIKSDGSEIKFGDGFNEIEAEINNSDEILTIKNDDILKISNTSLALDNDLLKFILEFENGSVPFELKEENLKGKRIHAVELLKYKREYKESFIWEENKIKHGTSEYYLEGKLKVTLNREKEIIEKGIFYGIEGINEIESVDLSYSEELTNAYNKIINYYKEHNNIPSLAYLNDEIIELYKRYIYIYNTEIEEINEKEIISNNTLKKHLLKIGTIESKGKVMFSPLAPLNIAYILELYNQLQHDVIETNILERLSPNNLLPYIYNSNNELCKPVYQKDNMEWIVFEKKDSVSIGQTNAFVARVVEEKINQFINNFNYLFPKQSNAPIKINVINIKNDREVVKGIFEYIKKQIMTNVNNIIPIEIKIFNDDGISAFDKFFALTSIDKLEEEFDIDFSTRNNEFDEMDVMRMTLNNIKCYKSKTNDYSYAHISFYKSGDDDKPAEDNTSTMESGLSIGGLLSTVTSNNNENDYRIGFGSKNSIDSNNELIRIALNLNEFAVNCYNKGVNPYRKDTSIVTRPLILEDYVKCKLYDSSYWVTFIEPNFGLEYFRENDQNNLIVIHYSDQYTSTEQYDTITVTNKSEQYKYIIREFLSRKEIEIDDEKVNEVIRSFNSINGEWLLNLIANKSEYDREKLSIISALKYGLALLNHDDIIWIPISLEEVLRVSNAVKLNKSEGIFSIKNLKQKGVHSDDLIFIGLNIKNENDIKVYYYPVEVKVGYNFSDVIDKGKIQIDKTYELLKTQLSQYVNNDRKLFKNKFFRNFFIKILISNAQKLLINGIWTEKHLDRVNELKKLLLNDDYTVSFELEKLIGKGALISFKKDNYWRSISNKDDILFVELTEYDAYYGISKTIDELCKEIESGNSDISVNDLLSVKNLDLFNNKENKEIIEKNDLRKVKEVEKESVNVSSNECKQKPLIKIESKEDISIEHNKARILLGEAEGSTKKVYWEYGNKELPNRHMLITGKSGNGKTYFIQCALKELVDNGVPSVIIDYTDGFKSSQLEPEFKGYLGDRLKQFIVAKDKFPLNPFKKGQKELDEDILIQEDSIDVAERFKSVVGAVYKDLGVQQLNVIYQAVIRGLDKYGDSLNLVNFRNELEEDSSSYAQTALSQLNLLIDKNPFEERKEFEWADLDNEGGKLFIIQLTGYTKDVQRIITEMILWDLWNYKTQHGRKDKPFAVVLDEAQNLNFGENSPSTKILTEGRKFGWSAWFATQFLKGQMDKATISRLQNSAQKIYFAQTEEEASSVASNFAENNEDRKVWTKKLINLEKGNCISYGPIEGNNGDLMPAKPIKLNITSLNDRNRS